MGLVGGFGSPPPAGMVKMSDQPSLFDPPDPYQLARKGDPATSHEAAQSLRAVHITKTRMAILDLLRAHPDGLTDQEIAHRLPGLASPSGLRTRRAELVDMGLVAESGQFRYSHSNRRMIVWIISLPSSSNERNPNDGHTPSLPARQHADADEAAPTR